MQKFVAIDFGGDAAPAILCRLDAYDLAVASDVDIPGARDIFGKGDDKFYSAAQFKFRFGKKI
jgi:hypothetical protein